MSRRSTSIAIVLLMVSSALVVLASSGWTPQGNSDREEVYKAHILDATPDHYWVGTTTDSTLSTNWLPVSVPSNGDNIYFSALSTGNCNWALTGSYGSFNLLANFTRTVTQAASFSVTSYSQAAGTFTGSTSYTLTNSGNFIATSNTITNDKLCLTMIGNGNTMNVYQTQFYAVTINDNTSVSFASSWILTSQLIVASEKTLTLNTAEKIFGITSKSTTTFLYSNLGTITGDASLYIDSYQDTVVTFGTVNTPVVIEANGASPASHIVSLGTHTILGSTLKVDSAHATRTVTLDLSASNYALSANGITIGTKGILNGRGSTITDSGNWDSSAGTFTQGTSSVRLTGASKTLKTDGTSGFNKLFLDAGASYTLSSNIHTTNYWKNGTLTVGGYTLYVNNNQAPSITSTPTGTTFNCASQFSYAYTGYDREGENKTYALTTNLSGLTLSTGNSTIWRHGANHARGTFTMHLSVTDGNHTVWQNSTLAVTNDAPIFTSTPILSVVWNAGYSYDANATDPEAYTLTYGSLGGLGINSTTGVVSKSPVNANGTFSVAISASDGNYTVWQNYTLTVINQYPVVSSRPRMSVVIHDSYSYLPAGTDPEGSSVIINVTFSAPWLTLNPNGTISGSPLSRDAGNWLVNVSFWDGYRTTYDNYTIEVTALDSSTTTILTFILSLTFCFVFLFLGMKNPIFLMLAGIIWILTAVTVFIAYGQLFLFVGLGVGFIGMIEGGLRYGR